MSTSVSPTGGETTTTHSPKDIPILGDIIAYITKSNFAYTHPRNIANWLRKALQATISEKKLNPEFQIASDSLSRLASLLVTVGTVVTSPRTSEYYREIITVLIGKLLAEYPALAQEWCHQLFSTRPISKAIPDLHCFCIVVGASNSVTVYNIIKTHVFTFIAADILGAREVPSEHFIESVLPILKYTKVEDLSGIDANDCASQVSRMLKRGPQILNGTLIPFFKSLAPGVAQVFANDMIVCNVPELRNNDVPRRNNAMNALAAYAENIVRGDNTFANEYTVSIEKLLTTLCDTLVTRNGAPAVTSIDIRSSIADAIAVIFAGYNATGHASQEMINMIGDVFVTFSEKDVSVGKERTFNAIATAFSTLTDTIVSQKFPTAVASMISTVFLSADNTQVTYVALGSMNHCITLLTKVKDSVIAPLRNELTSIKNKTGVSVVEKLGEIVTHAETRQAANRILELRSIHLTLLLCLKTSKAGDKADKAEKAEKSSTKVSLPVSVINAIMNENTGLNSAALVDTASEEELRLQILIITTFMTKYQSSAVKAAMTKRGLGLGRTIASIVLHPNTDIRSEANIQITPLLKLFTNCAISQTSITALAKESPYFNNRMSKIGGFGTYTPDSVVVGNPDHEYESVRRQINFVSTASATFLRALANSIVVSVESDGGSVGTTTDDTAASTNALGISRDSLAKSIAQLLILAASPLYASTSSVWRSVARAMDALCIQPVESDTTSSTYNTNITRIASTTFADATPIIKEFVGIIFGNSARKNIDDFVSFPAMDNANNWYYVGICYSVAFLVSVASRSFENILKPYLLKTLTHTEDDNNILNNLCKVQQASIPPSDDDREAEPFDSVVANSNLQRQATPIRWVLTMIRAMFAAPIVRTRTVMHETALAEISNAIFQLQSKSHSKFHYISIAKELSNLIVAMSYTIQGVDQYIAYDAMVVTAKYLSTIDTKDDPFKRIRAAAQKDTPMESAMEKKNALQEILAMLHPIRAIAEIVEQQPLPGPSFAAFYPLVQSVLINSPLSLTLCLGMNEDIASDGNNAVESTPVVPTSSADADDADAEDSNATESAEEVLHSSYAAAVDIITRHALSAAQENQTGLTNTYNVAKLISLTLATIYKLSSPETYEEEGRSEKHKSVIPTTLNDDLLECVQKLTTCLVRLCSSANIQQILLILSDNGVFSGSAAVRTASLQALASCQQLLNADVNTTTDSEILKLKSDASARISILLYDPESTVSTAAENTWKALKLDQIFSTTTTSTSTSDNNIVQSKESILRQIHHLSHSQAGVRNAAAAAIAAYLEKLPTTQQDEIIDYSLDILSALFKKSHDEIIPAVGVRGKEGFIDRSATRLGVAACLLSSCHLFSGVNHDNITLLQKFYTFILELGFSDIKQSVWNAIERAAIKATHLHGPKHHLILATIFDKAFNGGSHPAWNIVKKGKKGSSSNAWEIAYEQVDRMKEGAILLFGTVARYHARESTEAIYAFQRLITALDVDSEDIKFTVATCLSSLVPSIPGSNTCEDGSIIDETIRILMKRMVNEKSTHVRRGCARGFAAIIKGVGGISLKKYHVFEYLFKNFKDSKVSNIHGALAATGYLYDEMGSLLGPYAPTLLQHIVPCFGNGQQEIREVIRSSMNSVMSQLSSTSIKLVLPSIVRGFTDKSWRAKTESVHLLGSMSSLSPRELSVALPFIMPYLLDAMTDVSPQVHEAARDSIGRIADSIRNPELRRNSSTIVNGLISNNNDVVSQALHQLANITFRHYVDPASLSLVMPLVRKGLRDVDANIKKIAVQIAGAISLVVGTPQEMSPYMPPLVKYLRQLTMDSMPDIRLVTARALSAMYRASQSIVFPEFLQQLISIMNHEHVKIPTVGDVNIFADKGTTGVQRAGAALAVAALLHVQGMEATTAFFNTLEQRLRDPNQFVRESYILSLQTLPQIFSFEFAPLLETSLSYILHSIADPAAACRENATRAGQQLIVMFAKSKTHAILPSLIEALTADDPRVRTGGLMFTANFLLRLAGLSGKIVIADVEEDGGVPKTEIANRADSAITSLTQERLIEDAIGTDSRNEIYTSLYLLRSDAVQLVSTVAWRIWKSVVPSSARTINAILPQLIDRLVVDLASKQEMRQLTACQCMADLVTKLGDRVLRTVVPILEDKLTSRDKYTRKGVCLGFAEILFAGTRNAVDAYTIDFTNCIRTALCDDQDEVRKAARHAFEGLYRTLGKQVIHDIVPPMLQDIDKKHEQYVTTVTQMRKDNASEEDIDYEKDQSEYILLGLREILSLQICEKEALDIAIPYFIRPPVSAFHSECLAVIASALGNGFIKYVETVASSMLNSLAANVEKQLELVEHENDEDEDVERTAAESLAAYETEKHAIARSIALQAKLVDNAEEMFKSLGVENTDGLITVFMQSLQIDHHSRASVISAIKLLAALFRSTNASMEPYLNEIWRYLLPLLLNDCNFILTAVADAIKALTTNVHRDLLVKSIGFIRTQIALLTGSDSSSTSTANGGSMLDSSRRIQEIPGLAVDNCVSNFIGFYQHGLVSGSTSIRTQAAAGLAEIIELSPSDVLKGSVVKLAGTLIRTFGDRYSVEIRAYILQTLGLLVTKCGPSLRAFQSQLQTTFVKALLDENPSIRKRAAPALAHLMTDSRRVDALILELVQHLETGLDALENPQVHGSTLAPASMTVSKQDPTAHIVESSITRTLRLIYTDREITSRLEDDTTTAVTNILPRLLGASNNILRTEAAHLVGAIVSVLEDEDATALVQRIMSYDGNDSKRWEVRQGVAMALSAIEISVPERIVTICGGIKSVILFIAKGFNDDNELTCTAVVRFAGRMLLNANNADNRQVVGVLVQELLKLAVAASKLRENVTLAALQQVSHFAELDPSSIEEFNQRVIPLCMHARTGTGRPVRKEADTILYFSLGFNDNLNTGLENAEEFAQNLPENVAQEFIAVCKRSVMKLRSKDE